jgi:hypothetical protein
MEAEFVSEPNLIRARAAGPTVFVRRRDLDPVAESPSNSRWSVRLDVPDFRNSSPGRRPLCSLRKPGTECLRTTGVTNGFTCRLRHGTALAISCCV